MKKIVKRRKSFRINNPLAFGILCAMILILLAGIAYALVAGVISPAVVQYRVANATPSPSPTVAPVTATPSPILAIDQATVSPTVTEAITPTPSPEPTSLAGHIIGLDPSRGYSSTVQGVSTGVYANRLNYAIAVLVRQMLEEKGATVIFTLSDVKSDMSSADRAKIMNNGNVEIAIRIECNYIEASDTRGAMAWVPETHDEKTACKKLASTVLAEYVSATGLSLREINGESIIEKSDQTFLNDTNAPVFTLFLGHISNATEDKLLNDSTFQSTMAQGIVNGILKYFGVND